MSKKIKNKNMPFCLSVKKIRTKKHVFMSKKYQQKQVFMSMKLSLC